MMSSLLLGKVIFITGSSRGVGRALAIRLAREGAKIVIAAKSAAENPKLPGTIYSVADEVRQAGAEALAIPLDVREEETIQSAFRQVADEWGGVDVLINNASAIFPAAILDTPMKRFDLLMAVNVRGTFACSQAAIPYLEKSANPPHYQYLTTTQYEAHLVFKKISLHDFKIWHEHVYFRFI